MSRRQRNRMFVAGWIGLLAGFTALMHPVLGALACCIGFPALIYHQMTLQTQLRLDAKTRLYNLTAFTARAAWLLAHPRRRAVLAVAMLDLDHFKAVNDTYGHVAGDRVLLALAVLLKSVCGRRYLAARFGGEEFAILFCSGAMEDYLRLVEEIRLRFAQMTEEGGGRITLSAGLAQAVSGWDAGTWLDAADKALYQAKAAGRDRTVVYEEPAGAALPPGETGETGGTSHPCAPLDTKKDAAR